MEIEKRTLEIFAEAKDPKLDEKKRRENDEEIRKMMRLLEFTEKSCALSDWDKKACKSGGLEKAMEELLISFYGVPRI